MDKEILIEFETIDKERYGEQYYPYRTHRKFKGEWGMTRGDDGRLYGIDVAEFTVLILKEDMNRIINLNKQ